MMLALWPQLFVLSLTLICIGRAAARYGEVKKQDRFDIADVLIGPAINLFILYCGGFFDPLLTRLH